LLRLTLAKRTALIFFLAVAAFYLYGLGQMPLIGPDEPRYAEVAREMNVRGDMVTPTLGGHTWFEKPALLYWMMIGSYRLFGVSEWAARLGPALCGLFTIYLIYWMGRRVERATEDGERASGLGLWSGLAFASSAGAIGFSRSATFDIVLTLTLTLALVSFFISEIETDGFKRRLWLAGFYVAVGASLLAKGLVGIVIPFAVLAVYYALRRKWPDKRVLVSVMWGIPLAVAVAALWYAPVIARHGWAFINEFIIQHHFARFVSNKYHHPQPFYFYVPIIILLCLPWSAFLLAGLFRTRRWRWREESVESKFRIFTLAGFIAPIIFFSFSGSKLPGYVLPSLPGAAFLIGERLTRFVRDGEGKTTIRLTGLILIALVVSGAVYATRIGGVTMICALAVAAPAILIGVLVIVLKQKRALRIELMCSAMFISIALVLNCAINPLVGRESVRDLMQIAAARGYTTTPVFYMLASDRTAEFYAGGRLGYQPDGEPFRFDGADEVADAARARGGTALVLIPTEWEKHLTDYLRIETEKIGDNGVLSLFVIRVREQVKS
jgi:4-amino-4-deoxy-L-arabinose transferase-like glycosyltransferase